MSAEQNPVVSIIVPARNEESCLATCLDSLIPQTGITFEIIVVDDDSTDRTSAIAHSFPGIHPIPAGPLPNNWTGKNNAMSAGARVAKGKWLLFTDADTVHQPGSLARAVAEAEQHGAALLSYSPEQEVHGFWEMAVMPVIFAELAATYPPQSVNDPASPLAAANGQYLLISREVYDAVGGHTKISGDLLEDVAMARQVKRSGRKLFFRYGGDAVRTRMYRSFAQLREGWTKNLALLFPRPTRLAIWQLVQFCCILACANVLIESAFFGPPHIAGASFVLSHYPIPDRYFPLFRWGVTVGAAIGFMCLFSRHIWRTRQAHFSWNLICISVLGLPIFSYLLLRSRRFYKRGRLCWRDRTYVYSADEFRALRKQPAARAT